MVLLKQIETGTQQWVYNAGDQWLDEGRKVLVLDDGSFVCALEQKQCLGLDCRHTNTDILVTKISSSGQMIYGRKLMVIILIRLDSIYFRTRHQEDFIVVGSDAGFQNGGIFRVTLICIYSV